MRRIQLAPQIIITIIAILIKLFCVGSVCAGYIDGPESPTVKTSVGVIRGVRATNGAYDMYLGIPFARVNMSNPFGDSLPYPEFEGIFEANNDSAECIQIHEQLGLRGSLDCLQLSIYVPNNIEASDLPVMAYIFGGSLQQGSFTRVYHGPEFLMKYGVVFVIMNYRVGSYGTLCLDIPEVPGNQAFKDQLSALRWIHHHIKDFGGDPNKITIFGHSMGSICVSMQVLYAKEKLFHQAIMESGAAFYPAAIKKPNNTNIFEICKQLRYETNDVKEALKFLSKVEPIKVIRAEKEIGYLAAACHEMHYENVTNFITEYPQNVNITNSNGTIPIIIGNAGDESYYLFEKKPPAYFTEANFFEDFLKSVFNTNNEYFDAAMDLVRDFYTDNKTMNVTKRKFIDFHSDICYVYPNKRLIDKYLKAGAMMYHYVFIYCGGKNLLKNERNLSNAIATHGDELGYMFNISFPYMNHDEPNDKIVRHRYLTMLTNFAKYGDPTPVISDLLPYKWKPITNNTIHYMEIDATLKMRKDPFNKSFAFWDQFYNKFGKFEYYSASSFSVHLSPLMGKRLTLIIAFIPILNLHRYY